MIRTNCTVCGLPNEACLHQMELKDYRNDRLVLRVLWFALGFLSAAVSVITILILVNEKYL